MEGGAGVRWAWEMSGGVPVVPPSREFEVPVLGPDAPSVPEDEAPGLYAHQRAALYAMRELERGPVECAPGVTVESRVGVYGDKPGAGKTFVVCALIDARWADGCAPGSARATTVLQLTPRVRVTSRVDSAVARCTIVVAPHSMASYWHAHAGAYSARWGALLVSRSRDLEAMAAALRGLARGDPGAPRCLVVSATFFREAVSASAFHGVTFERAVFDEADTVTAGSAPYGASQKLARFCWLVTGSCQNLVSNALRKDVVVMRHSTQPERFPVARLSLRVRSPFVRDMLEPSAPATACAEGAMQRLFVVCDAGFVDASFRLPPPELHSVPCAPDVHSRILAGAVPAAVISRLEAGDVAAAIDLLQPTGAGNEDSVVEAAVRHLSNERDVAAAQLGYARTRPYATADARERAVERYSRSLEDAARRLAAVEDRIRGSTECPICFDAHGDRKTVLTCCQTSFCLRCIAQWMQQGRASCPTCRAGLTPSSMLVCHEAQPRASKPESVSIGGVGFIPGGGRLENLERFAAHAASQPGPSRLLVFSDNGYVLETGGVRAALQRHGVAVRTLKGNSNTVAAAMAEFRQSERSALLVNCQYYGCGMDMSAATDLVFVHSIDKGMHAQVVGRAQRPPRSTPLRVWSFDMEPAAPADP